MKGKIGLLLIALVALSGCSSNPVQSGGVSSCLFCYVKMEDNSVNDPAPPKPVEDNKPSIIGAIVGSLLRN